MISNYVDVVTACNGTIIRYQIVPGSNDVVKVTIVFWKGYEPNDEVFVMLKSFEHKAQEGSYG